MPSHFHWVVEVNPEFGTISDIMRDLKRNTSRELSELFADNKYYQDVFSSEAEGNKKQYRRVWMKSFDDEVIRNEKMFWNKLLYIHENPVEAGIVLKPEQFKYSSARNYIYGDHSIIEVDVKQGGVILY
jgi:REP element-mobilizing transposase RayT